MKTSLGGEATENPKESAVGLRYPHQHVRRSSPLKIKIKILNPEHVVDSKEPSLNNLNSVEAPRFVKCFCFLLP
jgi:hypothetical protein